MRIFKSLLLPVLLLLPVWNVYAAFPLKQDYIENPAAGYATVGDMPEQVIINIHSEQGIPFSNADEQQDYNPKNKTTAALLSFFLGGFGIHRFYLGYDWQGILQAFAYPLIAAGAFIEATAGATLIPLFTGPAAIIIPAVFIAGGIALLIWKSVDFFRIIGDDLQPRYGSYDD